VKKSQELAAPHKTHSLNNRFFEADFFGKSGTYVHPTALIGPNVRLEDNVRIGPYCVLLGNISIASGTRLFSHVTVGFPAQDTTTHESLGSIHIGNNCEIREFVTIHASKEDNGKTILGNECYIMNFTHIAHDVSIGNNVILINNVNIGGYSTIEDNVMLMANSAVHQYCRIGRFSCLTPYSGTRQDLPPFCLYEGQPGKFAGLNLVALRRANVPRESLAALKQVTKLFFQDKKLLKVVKQETPKDTHTEEFLQFIEESNRGVSRRALNYSYKNSS